jgi:hypothetical protein
VNPIAKVMVLTSNHTGIRAVASVPNPRTTRVRVVR